MVERELGQVYYFSEEEVELVFKRMTEGYQVKSCAVEVYGRCLEIPEAANGVAKISFRELCQGNTSAADYLAICKQFHSICITRIPIFRGTSMREEARRFVTLIDILYDNRVKLVAHIEAPLKDLFRLNEGNKNVDVDIRDANGSLFTGEEEIFAVDRTISRLYEMESLSWWSR